jgi:hypothetical protein
MAGLGGVRNPVRRSRFLELALDTSQAQSRANDPRSGIAGWQDKQLQACSRRCRLFAGRALQSWSLKRRHSFAV